LGIPVLAIHHVAKNADGTSPYGSVYHRNSARSVIEIRKEYDDAAFLSVGWFHDKLNDGRTQPAMGMEIHFQPGVTLVKRTDLRGLAELSQRLPVPTRLLDVLKEGAAQPAELAEELHLSKETVTRVLRRLRDRGTVLRLHDGSWGLKVP
jgi:hypothetical protein